MSVTYDGNVLSFKRVSTSRSSTRWKTDDGRFVMLITKDLAGVTPDSSRVEVRLTRVTPDPTPSDVFDPYRRITNSVVLGFDVDETLHEASSVLPLLQTALITLVDSSLRARLLAGEM